MEVTGLKAPVDLKETSELQENKEDAVLKVNKDPVVLKEDAVLKDNAALKEIKENKDSAVL